MSLQPTIAPMSPTPISFNTYASSALTLNRACTLSTLFKLAFCILYLFFRMPEYTLKKVISPLSLSFTTLNARAQSFSFLEALRVTSSFVKVFMPLATTFSGLGKYLMIASSRG
jgi:hypothetical protein